MVIMADDLRSRAGRSRFHEVIARGPMKDEKPLLHGVSSVRQIVPAFRNPLIPIFDSLVEYGLTDPSHSA
jgi:hypothetical protein